MKLNSWIGGDLKEALAEQNIRFFTTNRRAAGTKRLYHCVNGSTLGDYFDRMLLHAAVFPETAYRLEGFSLNSKSKALAPIVSQPHVAVATDLPPVTKEETDTLMAEAGFESVQLMFNGILDGGHYAYLNAATGTLAHDLHD